MTASPEGLVPRHFPVIFAAPSGAGKTTIARALGRRRSDVDFSISATTRPPRGSERDGIDYHFRSEAEFRAMISAGELLEWAEVHGQLYGTPRSNLELARSRRHFLLLDVDVQGSRQIRRLVPDAISIFVLPPDGTELATRLVTRASEDKDRQRSRLHAARDELKAAAEFDYIVVNDDVDGAVAAIEGILAAESHRAARLPDLERHVAKLIGEVDAVLDS